MPGGAMIDTDLVMVTAPYPAESRTMTSPPGLVTPMASLNARQGFAIEQLNAMLAGKPVEATNVRCAAALAADETATDTATMIDANSADIGKRRMEASRRRRRH